MAGAEDAEARMLAAINRLTAAAEEQCLWMESFHASQASTYSVIETLQMRLDQSTAKHQCDVAAQLKATEEHFEARTAQTARQPDMQRTGATPRKVHIREGRGDVDAPATPCPAPRPASRPASAMRTPEMTRSGARSRNAPWPPHCGRVPRGRPPHAPDPSPGPCGPQVVRRAPRRPPQLPKRS